MRKLLIPALLLFTVACAAQTKRWSISLQVNPELTFYKKSYHQWDAQDKKASPNIGFSSMLQYHLNKRIFVQLRAGFISRKLNSANILDQASLPPHRRSLTMELVTTSSISYRLLQIPFNVGYVFLHNSAFKTYITAGASANYLLNAHYNANFSKYDGTYRKNYWQGYSILVGIGNDYRLTKRISLSTTLNYAIANDVKGDEYLYKSGKNGVELSHRYLSLGIGAKRNW